MTLTDAERDALPFPHNIVKVRCLGRVKKHLRGKEALVSAVEDNTGMGLRRVRVQFDDTSLVEAFGQHWLEAEDYEIVTGRLP